MEPTHVHLWARHGLHFGKKATSRRRSKNIGETIHTDDMLKFGRLTQ